MNIADGFLFWIGKELAELAIFLVIFIPLAVTIWWQIRK